MPFLASLLDRLTESESRNVGSVADTRLVDLQGYRNNIELSLWRLLNTSTPLFALPDDNRDFVAYLAKCEHIPRSVLNYGIPPICGSQTIETSELVEQIRLAIGRFEPRVNRNTLEVKACRGAPSSGGPEVASDTVEIEILGDVFPPQKVPATVELQAEYDYQGRLKDHLSQRSEHG